MITPPEYVREENTIDFYEGDYGLITGIGTTSTSGVTTGITFDLVIPADSPLRDVKVAAPNAISRSGLSTGYYFMINSSNVGNGVTSLDAAGNYVGLGTTAVDNIYQVVHHVGVSTGTIRLGVTEVQRITVSVLSWNGLDSTVGASGTTIHATGNTKASGGSVAGNTTATAVTSSVTGGQSMSNSPSISAQVVSSVVQTQQVLNS